ncbi:MAG: glycosyltransferase [Deltaproteobacteria bacterium]|nr:glycosyltransferase [Deltaproteobacteria bacterium]
MSRDALDICLFTDGEPFHGDSPEEQALGGSETALVQVARALAARGHHVDVICSCPRPGLSHGVRYRDRAQLVELTLGERWDVLILSRFFNALDLPWQAGLRVLWNHDILDRPRALAPYLEQLDLLLVLSEFHAANFRDHLPATASLLRRTVNGLDLALLDRAAAGVVRDPDLVTYVSRPERGLKLLLEQIWPRLRTARPTLRLAVCGYQVAATPLHPQLQAEYARIDELLATTPGVEVLGALPKEAYYRHLAGVAALLYPCGFPEISCLAALEAQALGTPVLTTDGFALAETVREPSFRIPGRPGSPEYVEAYVSRAWEILADPEAAPSLAARAQAAVREAHDWAAIARDWEALFRETLARRECAEAPALAASLVLNGAGLAASLVLGREPRLPQEGPAPRDPREEELWADLAQAVRGLPGGSRQGLRIGVLAPDGGRTAGGLALALPGSQVEVLLSLDHPPDSFDLLVFRDILERVADPAELLAQAQALCREDGHLVLCLASGAWPLAGAGYLGRLHDLGRRELARLLPGRPLVARYLPRGLVGQGGSRYPLGRWLAWVPARGPAPVPPDPRNALLHTRPAPPDLVEELRRAGIL